MFSARATHQRGARQVGVVAAAMCCRGVHNIDPGLRWDGFANVGAARHAALFHKPVRALLPSYAGFCCEDRAGHKCVMLPPAPFDIKSKFIVTGLALGRCNKDLTALQLSTCLVNMFKGHVLAAPKPASAFKQNIRPTTCIATN